MNRAYQEAFRGIALCQGLLECYKGVNTFSPGSASFYKGEPFCLPRDGYQKIFPSILERLTAPILVFQLADTCYKNGMTEQEQGAMACWALCAVRRKVTRVEPVGALLNLRFDRFRL